MMVGMNEISDVFFYKDNNAILESNVLMIKPSPDGLMSAHYHVGD